MMRRTVEVDWIPHPGTAPAVQVLRDIGWANLQAAVPKLAAILVQLPQTMNQNDITAYAALAVMALLISDLENMTLRGVLQIGSGGDYLVQRRGEKHTCQIEGSGIRDAASPGVCLARLDQKKSQVLQQSNDGYASVTTFSYPSGTRTIVHSYLHYVAKKPKKGKKGGKKDKQK
jgi:hypothetical protein